MKRILLYLLLFADAICGALAQNDAMRVRLKNGDIYTFLKNNVDSIVYSKTGSDGSVNADYVVQEIATPDTVYHMPLDEIESVDFFSALFRR